MAKIIIGLGVLIGLLGAGPLVVSGCAGTPERESTGEYFDDGVITSKVKTALFRDPDVSSLQVNVETYKGQVQLSGFVDTSQQKTTAEQIARSVPGAKSVTNSIVVKSK
jgi:hyperosmotically inducible protein